MPESIWDLTLRTSLMTAESPTSIPTRQPAMLWLLDRELSSMQHSLAPGMANMDWGVFRMKP